MSKRATTRPTGRASSSAEAGRVRGWVAPLGPHVRERADGRCEKGNVEMFQEGD